MKTNGSQIRKLTAALVCLFIGVPPAGTMIHIDTEGERANSADSATDSAARKAGATADWVKAAMAAVEEEECEPSLVGNGFQAFNRKQNLQSRYRNTGVSVERRESTSADSSKVRPNFRFEWRTNSYGRRKALISAEPVMPQRKGRRVEYVRGGMTEWYENIPAGIEQGFTFSKRPDGDGEVWILSESIRGATPRMSSDGRNVELVVPGGNALRYGGLSVQDARGQTLSSTLRVEDNRIALVFNDADARYPVVVDPVITSAPAWTAESDQDDAWFGYAVAGVGDVNGDGFGDVVIGAPLFNNGQSREGRAYLYLGSAAGLGLTPAWTTRGNQADSNFGNAVAGAGDVNGDGYGDVLIGAPSYTNGQAQEGQAYLYLGSAAGLGKTPAWTAESDQAYAWLGYAVASAGDVNGDGYGDVVIGVPCYTNGQANEGRAYLYLGSATGLGKTPAWTAEGDLAYAAFGYAAAGAGDVNGDGYGDVVVGAPSTNYDTATNKGRAYLYLGSAAGLGSTPAWTAKNDQFYAWFGYSVAGAGDVNGDGYGDVVIGAPNFDNRQTDEGYACLYFGSAAGLGSTPAWAAESDQSYAGFGYSVSPAGDVNGDGYGDVVIGAPFYDNNQANEGRAYLYLGSAAGLGKTPAWTAESDKTFAEFGYTVTGAGDVNGDGFGDIVIGAPLYGNEQSYEGRAYSYLGGARCLPSIEDIQYGKGDGLKVKIRNNPDHQKIFSADMSSVRLRVEVNGKWIGESRYGKNIAPNDQAVIPVTGEGFDQLFGLQPVTITASYAASLSDTKKTIIEESTSVVKSVYFSSPFHVADNKVNPDRGESARILFNVPEEGARVTVQILDILGNEVSLLADGPMPAGDQILYWNGIQQNGGKASPGIYFITMKIASDFHKAKIAVVR